MAKVKKVIPVPVPSHLRDKEEENIETIDVAGRKIPIIEVQKTWAKNKKQTLPLGIKDNELPFVAQGTSREKNKHEKMGFFAKRKLKKNAETSYYIMMKFSNGTCKEFVISTTKEVFTYKKRTYYLRYEDSWFNLTQNQYQLFYFDDYPVPIDRKILKKGDSAFFSVTPENLKPLIEMNYVKVLANTQDLDKYLKMGAILGIINMIMLIFIGLAIMGAKGG